MGMYFGSRYVVVLSNPKDIHEVMKRDEWNGRVRDNNEKVKSGGLHLGSFQALKPIDHLSLTCSC